MNAGYDAYQSPDARVQALNDAQFEATTPWPSARHDAFTFRFAMDDLQRHRPRALYIAFDETDDWAHDRNYERLLDALHRIDGYLRELHAWIQADPEYRDTTSLIVTVDHGRGHHADDWSKHGDDVVGADETWMIAAGPRLAAARRVDQRAARLRQPGGGHAREGRRRRLQAARAGRRRAD